MRWLFGDRSYGLVKGKSKNIIDKVSLCNTLQGTPLYICKCMRVLVTSLPVSCDDF